MTLQSGTHLGPYEIVSLIGKGGMGEVYEGRDTRLDRRVAIKVIAESLAEDPRTRQRLEREARTISRLQHPNICTLYDIGNEGGIRYLVMEYLEGVSLRDRLAEGPLPLAEVVRIGREIADAVEAAHRSGVVHRDLKPGNVMLGPSGTKVLDFGLAVRRMPEAADEETGSPTLSEPLTEEGHVVGTAPYMAPEQLEGREADDRTDIWALGCILYEMATGARPFRADSRAGLIGAIMGSEPDSISTRQPMAPPRLEWLVKRCLAKDPERRWQSARDLSLGLSSLDVASGEAHGPGAPSAPTSMVDPVARTETTGRGSRSALWVAALALAAVVAVWWSRREPDIAAVEPGTAVAVLPFENVTGNEQLSYVGLGLAAGVISQLSELPGVNVVGRTQTWTELETARSSQELAENLGVSVLVEGEIHSEGPDLRVDVATTDGASSVVLWAESFRGGQDDLFDIQQDIAGSLARVLSVPLTAEERGRLARGGPSAQAFDFYLQGLERLEQYDNPRHLDFAADLFRQAIRIDDNVAVFHAALSQALSQERDEGREVDDPGEAEREARRALELDPDLPEASVALARALRSSGQYAESVAELRPILARHPKPDVAFRELAFGYQSTGDLDASAECLESAVALGPENWFNWNAMGAFQAVVGDVAAARTSLEKAVELAPAGVHMPRLNLGGLKVLEGDFAGAIEDFEATGASTSNPDLASNMATAYFYQGDLERAEELYRRAVTLNPEDHQIQRNHGDALLALGREQEAADAYGEALRLVERNLRKHPKNSLLLRSRALYAAKLEDCGRAVEYAETARAMLPENWENQLDLAMAFALCDRRDDALEAVKLTLESGFPGPALRQQAELGSLVDDPEFVALTGGTAP